jgi:septal ring factor EnvC (AmiA/AmiB activator)
MRRIAPLLIALPLLAAASAPVVPAGIPIEAELQRARTEQASAEREAARLARIAQNARNEADRLHAQQAAAAEAMDAAEARITAADLQLRLASAYVAAHRQQLAQEQRPVSSLLAGLAVMAQRPPLLAIADREASADELVKVRLLLDVTLPVIRSRTAKISSELSEGKRLELAAAGARAELINSRRDLQTRRQQFAALEQRALQLADKSGTAALSAGDAAISANESVDRLSASAGSSRSAAILASQLAAEDPAPARPTGAQARAQRSPFAYELPAQAAVTEGLAAIDESGVRARGLTLSTWRGAPINAPADGTVRFAGPFQDYDGILVIDHGGGWMSLLVNVSSTLHQGDRVQLGQPIGRALGPLQVELSQNGRRISPALIAGSSQTLSKDGKGG